MSDWDVGIFTYTVFYIRKTQGPSQPFGSCVFRALSSSTVSFIFFVRIPPFCQEHRYVTLGTCAQQLNILTFRKELTARSVFLLRSADKLSVDLSLDRLTF